MSFTKKAIGSSLALAVVIGLGASSPANAAINTAPVFHGVQPLIFSVTDDIDLMKGITAVDQEDGDITAKITHNIASINLKVPGEHDVKLSVTDSEGLTTNKILSIVVYAKANTVPYFTGVKNLSVVAGSNFDLRAGVKAMDAEDGDLTSQMEVNTKFNKDVPGSYLVTYSVTDSQGEGMAASATITVKPKSGSETRPPVVLPKPPVRVVNSAPVLSVADKLTVKQGSSVATLLKFAKASDKEDGNLDSKIKIDGKIDLNKPGTHKVKFVVADKAGAKSSKTVAVTVAKSLNTPPRLTGVNMNQTIRQGTKFDARKGVQAHDREDGRLAFTVVGSVDVNRAGTYLLAYTTKDSQGAVDTALSIVKVEAKKVTKADSKKSEKSEKSEKREKSSKSKKSGKR